MTRKDYQLITSIFSDNEPHDPASREWLEWRYLVLVFSLRLQDTNPNYDMTRFKTACGISE